MKMKIRALALGLALCLLLPLGLVACAGGGEVVLSYKNVRLTEDVYRYWLACYRAEFYLSETEGTTADFAALAEENIMRSVICVGLFDAYGLQLDAAAKETVSAAMERLVENAGGRAALEEHAAAYGITYKGLQNAITYEQKAIALRQYLFGTGGLYTVSDGERSDFYKENYARVQMIYIPYVDFVLDDGGNRVFDPQKGTYKYESKSGTEIAAQKEKVAALRAAAEDGMDEAEFAEFMKLYNEDKSAEDYPNGYYFTHLENYSTYIKEIPAAATDMKIGELREVKSEYGVHFLLRLAPEDDGYAKAENADFFESFETLVTDRAFYVVISSEIENVTAHEAKNGIRYEDTEPNFDLYWG